MSATATINSRAPAQPSAKSIPSLPATSRLLPRLPAGDNGSEHPPIHMKINSSILALLANSPTPPKITLEISDKVKSLRIGNFEYQGSLYKEPGHLEVYLPENSSASSDHGGQPCFRSHGQVRNRMTIKQDKPIKIAGPSDPVDLSQPTEQRILQLLMLGPMQPQDLASKAQASRELVDAVLAEVAEPRVAGSPLFIIKRDYQQKLDGQGGSQGAADTKHREDAKPDAKLETRPDAKSETRSETKSETRSEAKADAKSEVKPERVTKTLKELREARAAARSPKTAGASEVAHPKTSRPAAISKDMDGEGRTASSVPPELLSSRSEDDRLSLKRNLHASSTKNKRARSEAPEYLPTRRAGAQPGEPDEDMFEIARKFKNAYGEYLELYALLSKRKARPPSQVEKLMTMHRQLERWKNTLWTNARNKRMVN